MEDLHNIFCNQMETEPTRPNGSKQQMAEAIRNKRRQCQPQHAGYESGSWQARLPHMWAGTSLTVNWKLLN